MADNELTYLSIEEAARRIAAKRLSPVELAEAVFRRIDATDGAINAYVRLMRESARVEAREAEGRAAAGALRGPLDGIPIAVKDLYDTEGVVTAGGTGAYRERVPARDATAVQRLREAGAVIVGKTNTHELALGGTTNNVHYGATHNPWKQGRVPGGSSGGSGAALAAGQALGALGTDTGGSIRIPAAFCGVTGIKPTYGLVGRGGVIPLSLTLDHAGPMARSAVDCAHMLSALAGFDERDHDSVARPAEDFGAALDAGVRGLRLAVIPSLLEGSDAAVSTNFEQAVAVLAQAGAEIATVEPMIGVDDWRSPLNGILIAEGATYVEQILRTRPQTIGEPVRSRMAAGLDVPLTAYVRGLEWRKEVETRFERTLEDEGIDAYLAPTAPITAEPIGPDPTVETAPMFKFRNTSVFDHTHQPSVSVPDGFDAEGLPTGLMISTAKWRDGLALRIAAAYQRETDHHLKRPDL